jgi:hypothetical protein
LPVVQRAEDPENVLPLPPAFGDPAGDAPLLSANAPGNPVSLPSRRLMAAFLAKVRPAAACILNFDLDAQR